MYWKNQEHVTNVCFRRFSYYSRTLRSLSSLLRYLKTLPPTPPPPPSPPPPPPPPPQGGGDAEGEGGGGGGAGGGGGLLSTGRDLWVACGDEITGIKRVFFSSCFFSAYHS